jgi:hypothetical protein
MLPDSDTRPLPFRFGQVLGICDTLEFLLGLEVEFPTKALPVTIERFTRMRNLAAEAKARVDALSEDCQEHKRKLDDYERAEKYEAQRVARLATMEPTDARA